MDRENKANKKRPSWKLRWTWLLSIGLLVLAAAGLVLDLYIRYIRKSDLLAPYDAYVLAGLWSVAILVLIPLLIRVGNLKDWTGFRDYTYKKSEDEEIRPGKTL
jgi:hypothetical protein